MRFVSNVLRPFVWLMCRVLFRIEFHGVENIPPHGPCIIAPNHVTYADPIWISIPIRRRVHYMAWDKPFQIPLLGFLMRAFGAFPLNLDRVDSSAHRAAVNVLRSGRALVVFPEGGRSRTGKLDPFKPGAFRLALKHNAPIVPVTIRGAFEIWPVGSPFPRPGKLVITYHPVIEVPHRAEVLSRVELKERAEALARATRQAVARALDPASLPEDVSDESVSFDIKARAQKENV
ncbi:MAG TPA: lysophospholipid acyltransferase family protein [Blastocatellia bacterium]|nr:lysophospholipid acyltransferase family protein [Blastocatellia bacterium]